MCLSSNRTNERTNGWILSHPLEYKYDGDPVYQPAKLLEQKNNTNLSKTSELLKCSSESELEWCQSFVTEVQRFC